MDLDIVEEVVVIIVDGLPGPERIGLSGASRFGNLKALVPDTTEPPKLIC